MAGLEILFDVKDNASSKTKELNRNLGKLDTGLQNANKSFTLIDSNILKVAGSMYVLDKAYSSVIGNGLDYNKQLEQQTASIKTLLGATSQNIDSLGNQITVQQKFNLAGKEAVKIMKELERINASTPNSLNETAQIYKAMLPGMRSVGASQKDLIALTEKLSIAAGAAGIEFQSLLASVDGLATGTVNTNSDLGRFLKSLGITNETLKESKDVTALLVDKFKDFKVLDTIGVATSNLNVEWDKLTGTLTKDIFSTQKESIKELTKLIKGVTSSADDMAAINKTINMFANSIIGSIEGVINATLQIKQGFLIIDSFIAKSMAGWEMSYINLKKTILETVRDIAFDSYEVLKALNIDVDFTGMTRTISKYEQDIQLVKNATEKVVQANDDNFIALERVKLKVGEVADIVTKDLNKPSNVVTDKDVENAKKVNTEVKKLVATKSEPLMVEVDIGGSISRAIIDGINGSGLEDILSDFSNSVGNQLVSVGIQQAGIGAMAAGASPAGLLGAGVAVTAISGLMARSVTSRSGEDVATERLNDFSNSLADAVDVLKTFNNVGSTTSKEVQTQAQELKKYQDILNGVMSDDYDKYEAQMAFAAQYKNEYFERTGEDVTQKSFDMYNIGVSKDTGLTFAESYKAAEEMAKSLSNTLDDTLSVSISELIDFSNYSKDELDDIIPDFDEEKAINIKNALSSIAIEVKQGGNELQDSDLSTELQDLFTNLSGQDYTTATDAVKTLLSMDDYVNLGDYQDAIDALEDYNNSIAESTKQLMLSSNSYELAFASIGATTDEIKDLRLQQIEEEKQALILSYGELENINAENFVSEFEKIKDVLDDDLISSFEEYGDLLIEQASLNYEAAESANELEKEIIDLSEAFRIIENDIASQYDDMIKLSTAYNDVRLSIGDLISDILDLPISISDVQTAISQAITPDEIESASRLLSDYYTQEKDLLNTVSNDTIGMVESLSDAFKSMSDTIDDTISSLLGGISSEQSQDQLIRDFWNKRGKIDTLLGGGDLSDEQQKLLNDLVGDITGIAKNIQSTGFGDIDTLTFSLIRELDDLSNTIDNEDYLLKLNYSVQDLEETNLLALEDLKRDTIYQLESLESKTLTLAPDINAEINNLTNEAISYLGETSPIVSWLQSIDGSINSIDFSEFQQQQDVVIATVSSNVASTSPSLSYTDLTTDTNANILNDAYNDLFGRDVDVEGLAYWSDRLDSGLSTDNLTSALLGGAAAYTGEGYSDPETGLTFVGDLLKGFSSGGYTGNIGVNDIAGVVHGQEYVINAQTTKDLGLNGSGGVFVDMLSILESNTNKQQSTNERLAMLENIMFEILKSNRKTQDNIDYIRENGVKTI